MIGAGRLRERATIQAPKAVRGMGGGTLIEWQDVERAWCEIKGLRGREMMQAMQANVVMNFRIIMRKRSWLTQQHRFLWEGRVLEIVSIAEIYERSFDEIYVREVT